MAASRLPKKRGPRALDRLMGVIRDAEDWPLAGSAVRRMADAETWALIELKQRLDELGDSSRPPREADRPASAAEMLAGLVRRSRGIDPDAALDALYRQTLSQLVPDQVAMLDVLAERRVAPLCHLGASRLPAGPVSLTVLSNASSLGREAGVLLREYVPQYMTHLLALGLLRAGPEDEALEPEYELLMADTQLREMREYVRESLRLYPRTLRASVSLSDYGRALWRDCRPAAEGLLQQGRY
ncbi:hypothetical protein ACS8Y6_05750 [Salinisphaera sp. RV14]|uniref:Abi-alpha family protein n=1 Tax=unclassified Salinisphaera TaxID=2649847 RepID=UPI003F85B672